MSKKKSRLLASILCFATLIIVQGCGRVSLYQDLTEEEANEMMVLLEQNGVEANKKRFVVQNEVSFAVEVRESDLGKARSLLVQQNLPRRKELGLTGVYKEKGLIPTPDEQKARFLLALKGEIINSLERIPSIVDADVVLNVPTKDEFASAEKQQLRRPTASVVVRVKPSATGLESITESKIQQFVANSVEGMNPRDITVIISYITPEERVLRPGDVKTMPMQPSVTPVFPSTAQAPTDVSQELVGLRLDAESKARLKVYLIVFFLLLVVLSCVLIVVIVQGGRNRRALTALKGSAKDNLAIEGQVLEETPPKLGEGEPPAEL